ncbi:MAG: lipid A deacylase LpxR family protein [Bacteroidota bacterium]
MKKKIGWFFFLLLFIRCHDDGNRSLTLISGSKEEAGASAGSSYGHTVKSGNRELLPDTLQSTANRKVKPGYRMNTSMTPGIPEGKTATDSLFINRLNYLRSHQIEPDLNEPVSKNFLLPQASLNEVPSLITVNRETLLFINFDNDILDYTDRFYTNGIKIDLITPLFRMNPLSSLMVPYWRSAQNSYGISLVQNMYTPSTTKVGGILYGDRPYSAYLYIGSFKITLDPLHQYRQTSEIDIGIIGPKSYGEWVQRSFHRSVPTNNEPLGWEYQIKNDLVLDYSVKVEKGIANGTHFDLMMNASAEAGTLYSNAAGGFHFRTGVLNPYFCNTGVAGQGMLRKAGLRKVQFFIFIKGSGKLVGYDATLEGGLFNRTSSYTIPFNSISRLVFQGSGGFSLVVNGIRLDMEQFLLSPEFHNGWWHKWVHLSLAFAL